MDGLVSKILSNIDDTGREFTSTIYEQLGGAMENVFRLMLVIYVIWWGYNVMASRESMTPVDAAYRLGRAMLIFWFITSWDTFSNTIYELVQSIPEEVGKVVMQGASKIAGGSVNDPTAIGQIFDRLYEDGKKVAEQVYTGSLMDIFGALLALIVLMFVLGFTAVAVAAILAAKIVLFIVLALAPIWIILALYRWSIRFWDGFISLSAYLIIMQILIYGFIGFYSSVITRALNMAVNGGDDMTGKVAYVLPLLLVTLVGIFVLTQVIPMAAALLVGSAPVPTMGAIGAIRNNLRTMGRGTAAGWRGGTATMRQVTRGRQRLASDVSRREAARSLIAANARKNSAPLA